MTTIKRALDELAAKEVCSQILLTPFCPTTNDLRGFASPVKNGEIGCFNLESFLTNLGNLLRCTAEFVSQALQDLFLSVLCL